MYIKYTCGCEKNSEYVQCPERRDTNVKCSPVRRLKQKDSEHMCASHMVKPGTDEMRREMPRIGE